MYTTVVPESLGGRGVAKLLAGEESLPGKESSPVASLDAKAKTSGPQAEIVAPKAKKGLDPGLVGWFQVGGIEARGKMNQVKEPEPKKSPKGAEKRVTRASNSSKRSKLLA